MLVVTVTERVMHWRPGALCGRGRRANDMDDRHVLGVRARDPVDRAELPHAVRGQQRSGTVDAGVAVRRVRGVELVGIADPGQLLTVKNMVQERQVVVARNTEHMPDADFGQPG
jgi:hypothetical protein